LVNKGDKRTVKAPRKSKSNKASVESESLKRLQFDFTLESIERLDAMEQKIGATTRAELIRVALKVYEWMLYKAESGESLSYSNADLRIVCGLAKK